MTATAPSAATSTDRSFCSFRLAGRLFGVPVMDVKEVNTDTDVTVIPHAPPEVRGYANLRGNIHLVLDLRRMLGMPPAEVTADSRLIIFKPSVGNAFGILVDSVGDIVSVEGRRFEERRAALDDRRSAGSEAAGDDARRISSHDVVAGVCRLDGDLLIALNARRLLPAIERLMAG